MKNCNSWLKAALIGWALALSSFVVSAAQIAIVIDDIGYRATDKQALTLNDKVTLSFLPQTPYGKSLADLANQQNKEVLIHIPMESSIGKNLGPGAITSKMSKADITNSLALSYHEFPYAVGINNHMGSYLTTLYKPMAWTMEYLKSHQLLFLDSVTNAQSKGVSVAKEYGVPVMRRHVFLDNHQTYTYMQGQFNQLINKAKKEGIAIGIAHPHPKSVEVLSKLIPTLDEHNISLVKLSTLYAKGNKKQHIQHSAE